MIDIKQIKERLDVIDRKITRYEYNSKSLEVELEDATKQIYNAVDESNKTEREELDDLLMFINYLKTKFGQK